MLGVKEQISKADVEGAWEEICRGGGKGKKERSRKWSLKID